MFKVEDKSVLYKGLYRSAVLIGFTLLIFYRAEQVFGESPVPADLAILVIWALLMLSPIFSEMNFFGFGVKAELNKLKNDISNELLSFRSEIQASANANSIVNNYLQGKPPPDEELPEIRNSLNKILEQMQQDNQSSDTFDLEAELPNEARIAFAIRYHIEREIDRLYYRSGLKLQNMGRRKVSLVRRVHQLVQKSILPNELAPIILDIYSIASASIHGEDLSADQYGFLDGTSRDVIYSLKNIKSYVEY